MSSVNVMKRLILVFVLCLAGCSSNNEELPILALKNYALNYPVARNTNEINFQLPPLPQAVEEIVNKRVIDDDYKLYVALILARQYRSHITHASQSYIINKSHPLWIAFEKFSRVDYSSEYELSYVIYYNWLKPNSETLDPLLTAEYEAIKKELIRVGNPI